VRRFALISLSNLVLLTLGLPVSANAQSPSSTLNRWTPTANLTAARSAACAVVLNDGRLLVAGGLSDSGAVSTVDIYGTDGVFSAGPPMTQARARAACVTLNDGRVLVAGGNDGSGSLKTAEIFDPATNRWQPTGNLSSAREGHQMALNSWGFAWVAGGTTNGAIAGALELYYPRTGRFQAVGALHTPRAEFAMTPLGRNLVIAGGTDGTSTLSSVEIYDGSLGTVTVAGAMSQARKDFAAAALLDGTVLMTGGIDLNGATLTSTEIFDPVKGTSSAGPSLLEPRAFHSVYAMLHNGSVLIYGGSGNSGVLGTTELYTPWSGGIAKGSPLNSARRDEAKATVRAGSYMIAGGRSDLGYLSGSELFQFSTIATDKGDYAPGTAVKISGGGWVPGEQVMVTITAFPVDQHHIEFTGTATADGAGNIVVPGFAVDKSHLGMKFLMSAVGSQSQAEGTFTDGIDPTISYAFSPTNNGTAPPNSTVTVTVTLTPPLLANPTPTGTVEPCTGAGIPACPTGLTVAGANGTVCDSTPLCTLSAGSGNTATASFTIVIPAGSTPFSVHYSGDGNYNTEDPTSGSTPPGSPISTYTAQFFTATDMVSGPTGSTQYGSQTPYVANVCVASTSGGACTNTGTLSGSVQFLVNGVASGSPVPITTTGTGTGTASFIPSPPLAVSATPYTISATYENDPDNANSNSSATNGGTANISTLIVQDITSTTLQITTDADDAGVPNTSGFAQVGRTVTLTATTTDQSGIYTAPTGSFTFTLQGSYTVTSCGTLTAPNQYQVPATSTTGSGSNPGKATAPCSFTVTTAPETNTEGVTYNGDTNTASSVGNTVTLTTIGDATTTTLQITTDADDAGAPNTTGNAQVGRTVTLTATATDNAGIYTAPNGNFTFTLQGGYAVTSCGALTAPNQYQVTGTSTTGSGSNPGKATATCSFTVTTAPQTNTESVFFGGLGNTSSSPGNTVSLTTILDTTTTTLQITTDADDAGVPNAAGNAQVGRTVTLTATTSDQAGIYTAPTGAFTFTLQGGYTVMSCGTLMAANQYQVPATFTAGSGSNPGKATATCSFTVTAAPQTNSEGVTYNGDTSTMSSVGNTVVLTTILDTTTTTLQITTDADDANVPNAAGNAQVGRTVTITATTTDQGGANPIYTKPNGTFTFTLQGGYTVTSCGTLVAANQYRVSGTSTTGSGVNPGQATATCSFTATTAPQANSESVTYNGDANTATSNGNPVVLTTVLDTTTTTLQITTDADDANVPNAAGNAQVGRTVTITATTADQGGANPIYTAPAGTFTFTLQGGYTVTSCGTLVAANQYRVAGTSTTGSGANPGQATAACSFTATTAPQANSESVTYNGDTNTATSNGNTVVLTTVLDTTTTTLQITTDADDPGVPNAAGNAQVGRTVTITATTSDQGGANAIYTPPAGTFTFTLQNGFTVTNCGSLVAPNQYQVSGTSIAGSGSTPGTATAACSFTTTAPQIDTEGVTYNGDTNTATSTGNSVVITSLRDTTTTTLQITADLDASNLPATSASVQAGRIVTITATTSVPAGISNQPAGTFTFTLTGGNYTSPQPNCGTAGANNSFTNAAGTRVTGANPPAETASCTFTILGPPTNYTYAVAYVPDSNTLGSAIPSPSVTFAVSAATTNTTIAVADDDPTTATEIGRVITLTATTKTGINVFATPTGSFTFNFTQGVAAVNNTSSPGACGNLATGATSANVTLTTTSLNTGAGGNGTATATCTFILVGPPGGTSTLNYTANYLGDNTNTAASSAIQPITTVLDGTTMTACVSTSSGACNASGNAFTYGQAISFSSTLLSNTTLPAELVAGVFHRPNASVTFNGSGLNFVTSINASGTGGTASWPVTFLPPVGSYAVNVSYPTVLVDPYYAAPLAPPVVNFTITKANTLISLQALNVPAGVPNLRVTVYNCTFLNLPGVSTCTLLAGSPTGAVQVVSGGLAPTGINSTNGLIAGGTVVATGNLAPSSDCGGLATACGAATLLVPTGSYNANYLGDSNFTNSNSLGTPPGGTSGGGSTSATSPVATSSLTLSFAPTPANPGTPVTITAAVSGTGGASSPSGTVTFTDNGVLIGVQPIQASGSAVLTYTPGPGSSHTIVAIYSGDNIYPSASTSNGLTITKLTANTPSSLNGTTTAFGQSVNLSVRIAPGSNQAGAPVPTGTVQFFIVNGSNIGSPVTLINGSATSPYSGLPPGTYTIGVTYSGDSTYNSFTASIGTITVNQAQVTVVLGTPTTSNGQMSLTATLTVVAPGAGTPTGTVAFKDTVTGSTLATANVSGGAATATVAATGDAIVAVYSGDTNFLGASSASAAGAATITALNAASDVTGFSADSIVSLYGSGLATQTVSGTSPLQSSLGGVSVTVTDSAGVPRQALLFFVSPAQINLLIPAGTATGAATITVNTANGSLTTTINISASIAALFTANNNGSGPLAAQVVAVAPGGQQTYTNTAALSGTTLVNAPISLSPAGDTFYLLLYGTGFDTAKTVTVTINGQTFTPSYFGPQGAFAGLDQANVLLPASLAGTGQVNVSITVDGQTSNVGTIAFAAAGTASSAGAVGR
jgi:large repetitive protein